MSDFKDLYKPGIIQLKEQQTKRREKLLEEQRKKRDDDFFSNRDIKVHNNNKWRKKRESEYKFNLMLSEFMAERPDDLENFLLQNCPTGIRCTLSNEKSKNNFSILYYKNGTEFLSILTNIPKSTVLDCIYCEKNSMLFILDLIRYDGRDFVECEKSFRNYWIKNKFIEDDLKIYENNDKHIQLKVIEAYDMADSSIIQNVFSTYPIFDNEIALDGYLFYHKEGFYLAQQSPLALWLFPYMVEEVLPMFKVHPFYNDQKPANYTNYLDYINEFNMKLQLKKQKRTSRKSDGRENMDVQEIDNESDEMQKIIDLEMNGDF